jgi:hypothetical protein
VRGGVHPGGRARARSQLYQYAEKKYRAVQRQTGKKGVKAVRPPLQTSGDTEEIQRKTPRSDAGAAAPLIPYSSHCQRAEIAHDECSSAGTRENAESCVVALRRFSDRGAARKIAGWPAQNRRTMHEEWTPRTQVPNTKDATAVLRQPCVSSTRFNCARSLSTIAASRSKSGFGISGRWNSVNSTSLPSSLAITRIGT